MNEQKHKLPERVIFRPGEMTEEIETRLEQLGRGFGAYVRYLIRVESSSTRIEPVETVPILKSVQLRLKKEIEVEGVSPMGVKLAQADNELSNCIQTMEGLR